MSSDNHQLASSIFRDLFGIGRLQLILLMTIFISAIGVVLVTHSTRQLVVERNNLYQEKDDFDNEWRNLILEETALSEHSRVQQRAINELNMKRPDSDKEVIVNFE
ncbi:MAG: cell division protein FtsL [Aliivibrio sp.]|uniref:cell division protein FtsL n=1 Tax=Aliivibrio sp. TaxID=1872443 RepID=UPI001A5297FD|nr:cell division protein FtsL [Aliivibrio sp.]